MTALTLPMKNVVAWTLTFLLLAAGWPSEHGTSVSIAQQGAIAAGENVSFSDPVESLWRIGVKISAPNGPCEGIETTTPVPIDWNEQDISLVSKSIPQQVGEVTFRSVGEGVKQMVISIPQLKQGDSIEAFVVLKIEKRNTIAPVDPTQLQIPSRTEVRKLRAYLSPSPFIESRDRKITKLADEIVDDDVSAWKQVESIYQWVRENVRYEFDTEIKSCLTALADRQGDCEEMSSLFIALCRAKKIPARAVWVPGHTYPEFYLVDSEGTGHWYPCQVAGADYEFGEMNEARPILQRGDNFRVPNMKEPMRYVQPTLIAKDAKSPPMLTWIIEQKEPASQSQPEDQSSDERSSQE